MTFGGRDCTGVSAPLYLSFFTASVSFVLFLVTSVGNLLVCLAVYKDPKKQLRTPFNMFVVNLACADLIVGIVVSPIAIAIHVKEGLTGELSQPDVSVLHMFYFISCTASVLSLAALTIDRHIAITSPLYYKATKHTRKVVIASLAIWIISASVPFLYLKVGYIRYAFVFANMAIALTLVILIVSCAYLFRKMRHRSEIQLQLMADKVTAARLIAEKETRLTKTFLIMLVAFLSCYTPSCVMIYIMNFCTTCSCYSIHWLRDLQSLILLINSCLNPFVYAWRIPAFRNAASAIARQCGIIRQTRLNLPTINNSTPTSNLPIQLVTRKEQSQTANVEVIMENEGAAQNNELNCVFD